MFIYPGKKLSVERSFRSPYTFHLESLSGTICGNDFYWNVLVERLVEHLVERIVPLNSSTYRFPEWNFLVER